MIKNVTIALLGLGVVGALLWADGAENRVKSQVRDKPEVHIFLPDGYCGEFVVFWGENTPPVDEPPELLSYNYYPDPAFDGVVITLPEPYQRAQLRFLYDTRSVENAMNPVFRMISIGTIGIDGEVETDENGWTRTVPDSWTDVDSHVFEIESLGSCKIFSDLDRFRLSHFYRTIAGSEQ